MMKKVFRFTLVELLVVVGIIALLAGLLLPAIVGGATQGRITQAKSDMKSILMALNQMDTTYQKMWDSSAAPTGTSYTSDPAAIKFGGGKAPSSSAYSTYEEFILVLTNPDRASNVNVNKRKIKFLDAKTGFDPSPSASVAENHKYMWLDPWGNEYVVIIDTSGTDQIVNPTNSSKRLSGKAVAYSFGPNGTDNSGRNVDTGGGKLDDDITSWDK